MKTWVSVVLMSIMVSACGGGGSSSRDNTESDNPSPTGSSAQPAAPSDPGLTPEGPSERLSVLTRNNALSVTSFVMNVSFADFDVQPVVLENRTCAVSGNIAFATDASNDVLNNIAAVDNGTVLDFDFNDCVDTDNSITLIQGGQYSLTITDNPDRQTLDQVFFGGVDQFSLSYRYDFNIYNFTEIDDVDTFYSSYSGLLDVDVVSRNEDNYLTTYSSNDLFVYESDDLDIESANIFSYTLENFESSIEVFGDVDSVLRSFNGYIRPETDDVGTVPGYDVITVEPINLSFDGEVISSAQLLIQGDDSSIQVDVVNDQFTLSVDEDGDGIVDAVIEATTSSLSTL